MASEARRSSSLTTDVGARRQVVRILPARRRRAAVTSLLAAACRGLGRAGGMAVVLADVQLEERPGR